MESQKIFVYIAFFFMTLLLWNTWEKEHVPQKPTINQNEHSSLALNQSETLNTDASSNKLNDNNNQNGISKINQASLSTNKVITVVTDTIEAKINQQGGNIVSLKLLKYPESLTKTDEKIQLLNSQSEKLYIAQSALISNSGPDKTEQQALYSSDKQNFVLANDKNSIIVKLNWQNSKGLTVNKIYQFDRGKYLIKVSYVIDNNSNQTWSGYLVNQILRKNPQTSQSSAWFQIHPFIGAAISSPEERYKEINFKKMETENLNQNVSNGWLAMVQHYFLSAWIPNTFKTNTYFTDYINNDTYVIGMKSPDINVESKQHEIINSELYVGPSETDILKNIAPGLDLTVSYGWLWPISAFIFSLMKMIHQIVLNWGWSIVLVTLLIKLIFYPLSAKSYSSMANMRKIQPKMEELKQKYGDDKQKLSQAMMEIYKTEKINPLGGCLPILIQIPVFFALYMVLLESVELRQAPWILWIHDLSMPDPFYVLPILMGLSMLIQQKLNPPPPDPTQAKMMLILPIVFTVLFINFPSGLVLYWIVNNVLSILQQWYIMRRFELAGAKAKV